MTELQKFELPSKGADGDIIEVALAQLNAVKISEDQLRRGCGILIAASVEVKEVATAFDRLWAYAKSQNLYPPDVAAEAIAIRAGWLRDFIAIGGDPEIEWDYARFAASPIGANDLVLPGPEDEDDGDEIPW